MNTHVWQPLSEKLTPEIWESINVNSDRNLLSRYLVEMGVGRDMIMGHRQKSQLLENAKKKYLPKPWYGDGWFS